jgi:inosine/xanthosine triphosphatase
MEEIKKMKKIFVASNNPVKIEATVSGFQKMFLDEQFKIDSDDISSGVRDQPMSNKETLQGAINRVNNCFQSKPDADYWVGIEGGIEYENREMAAFAWVVIKSKTLTGKAKSGTFFLPKKVAQKILEGKEMGLANDIIFKQKNSKQHLGAIGILTHNVLNRTQLYEHAVVLALVVFKNVELYS